MYLTIREKVDDIRVDERYSFKQLSEATGISDYSIKKFVYGDGILVPNLIKILDVLGYELYLKEIKD